MVLISNIPWPTIRKSAETPDEKGGVVPVT